MVEQEKSAAGASASGRRKHVRLAGMFLAAFVLAFGLAWLVFAPKAPTPAVTDTVKTAPAPARVLSGGELQKFFEAVDAGDFAAMERLGHELFTEGAVVPDSKNLLSPYAVNSSPPHMVYAFFTRLGGEKSYRVLLIMDENDKVVSFMAEETDITK